MNTYFLVGILVLLALIAIFVVYKRKEEKTEPNYRLFFILGVTWIPLGFATDNPGFWGAGIIFMILGLVNKDKWKDQPKWSELPPEQRKTKMFLIIGLTVLLLVGIAAYILSK